jgi:hypothetical protein
MGFDGHEERARCGSAFGVAVRLERRKRTAEHRRTRTSSLAANLSRAG